MIGMGCRAVAEIVSITNRAVVMGPIGKGDIPEWIELEEEWVYKNRVGDDVRALEAKIFPDHDNPNICMVQTLLEMQRRKKDF